jgi:hypothetical protein
LSLPDWYRLTLKSACTITTSQLQVSLMIYVVGIFL